ARAHADRDGVVELVVGDRLPDAERQRAALLELPPEPQRAEPAVLVVDGGHAALVGEPHAGPHCLEILLVGPDHVALLEAPRRLLAQPSSIASLWPSAQVGKCTCESVKPGTTTRPPRSITSGEASAVSWTPTPPAIHSPAIASARCVGTCGSSVRMRPFSRITWAV